MTVEVSVVAVVDDDASDLVGLVVSLDGQTLPYQSFDVTFLVDSQNDALTGRLEHLSARRPQVQLGQPDSDWLDAAEGEYVLLVGAALLADGVALTSEALRRLTDCASSAGCDVVVGRTVRVGETITPRIFAVDSPRLTGDQLAELHEPLVLLARRELVVRVGLNPADVLAGAESVGVLASYPTARLKGRAVEAAAPAFGALTGDLSWSDHVLVVGVHGNLPPGTSVVASTLWLRERDTQVEFWLPTEGFKQSGTVITASYRLDPLTAAAGAALPVGLWECGVALAVEDQPETLTRVELTPTGAGPAVLDGLPVIPAEVKGKLTLDVGAKSLPLVRSIHVGHVTIEESVTGTLLRAKLPAITVAGPGLNGGLLLGKLRLPAELAAVDGGGAELRCYVSGLSGVSKLATQFGTARPAATGIDLHISPVGRMTVEESPTASATEMPTPSAPQSSTSPTRAVNGVSKQSQTKAQGQTPSKRPAVRPSRSLPGRIRHALPQPLEPAVRTVARNPLARKIYQRLAGLPLTKP